MNIYAPSIRAPRYMKQMRTYLKEAIDSNTAVIEEDFSSPLSGAHRLPRKIINRETLIRKHILEQSDVTVIQQNCPSNNSRIHIFSSAHKTFSRRKHILSHKMMFMMSNINNLNDVYVTGETRVKGCFSSVLVLLTREEFRQETTLTVEMRQQVYL